MSLLYPRGMSLSLRDIEISATWAWPPANKSALNGLPFFEGHHRGQLPVLISFLSSVQNQPTPGVWGFYVIHMEVRSAIKLLKSSPRTTVLGQGDVIGLG